MAYCHDQNFTEWPCLSLPLASMQLALGCANHISTLPATVLKTSMREQMGLTCPCPCLAAGNCIVRLFAFKVRMFWPFLSDKGLRPRFLLSHVQVSQPAKQNQKA